MMRFLMNALMMNDDEYLDDDALVMNIDQLSGLAILVKSLVTVVS